MIITKGMNGLWRYFCTDSKIYLNYNCSCFGIQDQMESTLNGCKDNIYKWCDRRRSMHWTTSRFETHYRNSHVCRLKKALYGLKQAPRAWYGRIDGFLMRLAFTKRKVDSNLYYKVVNEGLMILLLYGDDLFLLGEENLIDECKKKLFANFQMKYLGMMHCFYVIEVW